MIFSLNAWRRFRLVFVGVKSCIFLIGFILFLMDASNMFRCAFFRYIVCVKSTSKIMNLFVWFYPQNINYHLCYCCYLYRDFFSFGYLSAASLKCGSTSGLTFSLVSSCDLSLGYSKRVG